MTESDIHFGKVVRSVFVDFATSGGKFNDTTRWRPMNQIDTFPNEYWVTFLNENPTLQQSPKLLECQFWNRQAFPEWQN